MNEQIKYENLGAEILDENLGAEILAFLRSKADAKWEYYNPHFLADIADAVYGYYQLEDEVVWDWIRDMVGA